MNLSGKLFTSAIIAALGGFIFGFDTVVISGAEQEIQKLWGLSGGMHGWVMSAALWGTVLGSLLGGIPTDALGRKPTLAMIGILYFVSAIWSAMANDPYSFIIARFIGGIGVGVSTVVAPLYISEIAPAALRGRLAGMFQFNIVFGILVAFGSNYLIGKTVGGDSAWRWMMGVEAAPALLYSLMVFLIPESPRWLLAKRNDEQAAKQVLTQINPETSEQEIDEAITRIQQAAADESQQTADGVPVGNLRKPIMLAFLVAFFNQLSGINAILYFAPRIFGMTGIGGDDALLQSISLGVVNLIFTMLGLWLIDRLGRKSLLLIGGVGYIVTLGLVTATFQANSAPFAVAASAVDVKGAYEKLEQGVEAGLNEEQIGERQKAVNDARAKLAEVTQNEAYAGEPVSLGEGLTADQANEQLKPVIETASEQSGSGGLLVLIGILGFIASHAVGQGAVIWVLISEVFPNKHRAFGNTLGSATHWVFAALMALYFTKVLGMFDAWMVFGFFAFMMVLHLIWVLTMVPETKGVSLEELQKRLNVS